MAKLDYIDIRDSFLGHMMIKMMGQFDKFPGLREAFEKGRAKQVKAQLEAVDRVYPYEVKFIVDGVEWPVVEAFEALKEQHNLHVMDAAVKLVKDQFSDKLTPINDEMEKLDTIVKEAIGLVINKFYKELGIEPREDDDF